MPFPYICDAGGASYGAAWRMARFGACDQIALLLLAVSMARDLSWASPQQNAVMAWSKANVTI